MKTIKVDEKLRDEIQALDYEATSLRELLHFMWCKTPVNKEAVDYYTKQYAQSFAEFETAKKVLTDTYNLSNVNWNFDYASSILTYEELTDGIK